jgi:hypothetical protein
MRAKPSSGDQFHVETVVDPAEQRPRRQIDEVMLFGKQAIQADQDVKGDDPCGSRVLGQ